MTSSSPGSLPKTQQHPQESRVPTLSTPLTHDLEDEAPVYIPKLQRAQATARAPASAWRGWFRALLHY